MCREIAVGETLWGVATWEDIDPQIVRFSVYVSGLTNAYKWKDEPGAYKPGDPILKGRKLYRKTLQAQLLAARRTNTSSTRKKFATGSPERLTTSGFTGKKKIRGRWPAASRRGLSTGAVAGRRTCRRKPTICNTFCIRPCHAPADRSCGEVISMAHKKGQGSSRNGRDSQRPTPRREAIWRRASAGGQHPHPPSGHTSFTPARASARAATSPSTPWSTAT